MRLPLRFSLRSLLMGVTLFSVWCGYELHRADRQKKAILALGGYGALYQFPTYSPRWFWREWRPATERNLLAEPDWLDKLQDQQRDLLYNVDTMTITGLRFPRSHRTDKAYWRTRWTDTDSEHLACLTSLTGLKVLIQADDHALAAMAPLRQLQQLELADASDVTERGLASLGELPSLSGLSIPQARLSAAGLRQLPPLYFLDLNHCQFERGALAGLKDKSTLTEIDLSDTNLTDADLEHLHALHELEAIWLAGSTGVSSEGIQKLKDALPNCNVESVQPRFRFF